MRMKNAIVVVDFSGTLIQPFVAEQANLKRYEILGIPVPSEQEQKKFHGNKAHYQIIKEYIAKKLGVTENLKIQYSQRDGTVLNLKGKEVQTLIMTDLFRDGMYAIAQEKGLNIFAPGILEALAKIGRRYKLAIVSGIRTDIITGMLAITKCPVKFDYILGEDPFLGSDNDKMLKELSQNGKIEFIIGDKLDDLKPARKLGAKSIFVTWGHPTGGEGEIADFVVRDTRKLEKIILYKTKF